MKATITQEGELRILSESTLEEYALKKWWENFNNGTNSSSLSWEQYPNAKPTQSTKKEGN